MRGGLQGDGGRSPRQGRFRLERTLCDSCSRIGERRDERLERLRAVRNEADRVEQVADERVGRDHFDGSRSETRVGDEGVAQVAHDDTAHVHLRAGRNAARVLGEHRLVLSRAGEAVSPGAGRLALSNSDAFGDLCKVVEVGQRGQILRRPIVLGLEAGRVGHERVELGALTVGQGAVLALGLVVQLGRGLLRSRVPLQDGRHCEPSFLWWGWWQLRGRAEPGIATGRNAPAFRRPPLRHPLRKW